MGKVSVLTPKNNHPSNLTGRQGPQGEIERSYLVPPWNQDPPLHQKAPPQPEGPRASPYLTKEDIAAILLEARKAKSSAYIDTRPPYAEEMARKPYHANYTPLIFPKYDGMCRHSILHP